MKIAIASEGKAENSVVSEKGGRTPYILIYEDNKLVESIKNPFALGSGGAGFSVAYMVAEKGVDLFVAGKIGDKMASALKDKGVDAKELEGNVETVIDELF